MIEEEKGIYKYHCNDCNIEFYSKDNNLNQCIYCYSNNIGNTLSTDKDIKVIPFTLSTQDAINNYKKKVKFNPLIPLVFKSKKTINNIKKIYLPAYLTDINQSGTIEFIAGDKNNKVLTKYSMMHTVNFDYKNCLLNSSNSIDDDIFSFICTYNYDNLKDTKYSEIEDYIINTNISSEDISNKAKEIVSKHSSNIVRNNINHSLKKLKSDNTIISFNNTKEIYVPVYLLNIKYNNKNYQYIMNGENSKSKINLVCGIKNTIIFSIISFLVIFILGYLIALFL